MAAEKRLLDKGVVFVTLAFYGIGYWAFAPSQEFIVYFCALQPLRICQ
jgi:hypothetical protein